MKENTGMSRLFVTLPTHLCSDLSPQISLSLQTRMANYEEDISVLLSSHQSLKTLCDDYSSIVEKSRSTVPVNWSVHSTNQNDVISVIG